MRPQGLETTQEFRRGLNNEENLLQQAFADLLPKEASSLPTKYTFEQISQFLAQSNGALGSVGRRFLAKMVFGLIVAESVLLSEITRALGEKISPKQTYNRLDHSLGRYDFEPLADEQARRSCALVTEDHVIALDGGDIAKPCARYLEALARIRDGSKKVITNGYELMSAVAVRPAGADNRS